MEHPGEIWQEFDYNGERLGGIEPASLVEDRVKLFGGAVVMLYRYVDGEVEFLFQHRSRFLKRNAGKWDVSAGGHINLDESVLNTVERETKEEIGVEVSRDKLEFAATYVRGWRALVNLYFYDWSDKKDEFCFDDQEVEEVKWVKYNDLEEFSFELKDSLRKDEIFFHYLKEWNKKILKKHGNL